MSIIAIFEPERKTVEDVDGNHKHEMKRRRRDFQAQDARVDGTTAWPLLAGFGDVDADLVPLVGGGRLHAVAVQDDVSRVRHLVLPHVYLERAAVDLLAVTRHLDRVLALLLRRERRQACKSAARRWLLHRCCDD